jgi:acyl-CoA synthetase (AMP-forming)/AMP-acid ligase II
LTTAGPFALSERISDILALDPLAPALEFERRWHSWGELADSAKVVGKHVSPGDRVAVLLRNHPSHVGLLLGLLQAGACVVTVNPGRGTDRVRSDLADLTRLGVAALAGRHVDLETLAPPPDNVRWLSSNELGSVKVTGERPEQLPWPQLGVAVEMLTSGTTGPAKRIPLTYETFSRVMAGAKHYEGNKVPELRLRRGTAVINAPLVHLGGLFRVLQCVSDGRAFCLLERFRLEEWADAVRRHRPTTVSLVPTALRMVLDADLDPEDFASVRSVVSGTAPLSADDADAFYAKYGVPVLISYAATEFGGGVAGWNLADHQQYWTAKRGSAPARHPGPTRSENAPAGR